MKNSKLVLFMLLVFVSLLPAKAHHEGTVGGPGIAGPLITFPARTLPKGKFFINTGIKYNHYGLFDTEQLVSLKNRGETTGQISHALTPSIGLGYGITGNWDVYLSMPYNFKFDLIETDGGQITEFGDSSGLGDLTVLSQYRFLRDEKHGLYASLIGGLSIPTGFRSVRNNQGDFFGNDDQPSTGSWDPYMGFAVSKNLGAFSLDTNTLYRLSTPGPRGGTVGDVLNYNLALSYTVQHNHVHQDAHSHGHPHSHGTQASYHSHVSDHHHHEAKSLPGRLVARALPSKIGDTSLTWNLITELNYNWQERPELDGVKEENHGGHILLATEGIRAIINDNFVTNLGISLPVITGFNGAQPTPSLPAVFMSFSYLF